MTEVLRGGLDVLTAGGPVLVVLGIVSVWVWALIIAPAIHVYQCRNALLFPQWILAGNDEVGDRGGLAVSRRVQRRVVHARVETVVHAMAANVSTVLILASLAPVLGLLGTVEGMITTFKTLASVGGGDAAALGAGISEALITTQGGLLVSIPSLLAGGILFRKVQKLRDRLRASALRRSGA